MGLWQAMKQPGKNASYAMLPCTCSGHDMIYVPASLAAMRPRPQVIQWKRGMSCLAYMLDIAQHMRRKANSRPVA